MSNSALMGSRPIAGGLLQSPLLVPSYSSRGFTPIGGLYDQLSSQTSRVCLMSAYDLFYKQLPYGALDSADVVFLDSGGYEAHASSELSEPQPWTQGFHRQVLDSLRSSSTAVPITYDYGNHLPTAQQFDCVLSEISRHPSYEWDILLKPEQRGAFINTEAVLEGLADLPERCILGFTDDELGLSLLARCQAIAKVRRRLNELGYNHPIHVFGCLDPLVIPYYVTAGADVFDGLQWLRSSMTNEGLVRFSTHMVRRGDTEIPETRLKAAYAMENLDLMHALQKKLRRYVTTSDLRELADLAVNHRALTALATKLMEVT